MGDDGIAGYCGILLPVILVAVVRLPGITVLCCSFYNFSAAAALTLIHSKTAVNGQLSLPKSYPNCTSW